jgi:hypothetical protein
MRSDGPIPSPFPGIISLVALRFSEVASRLNGISTPVAGVSWTPPRSDVAVARSVLNFLEDRRVLYEPYQVEMPSYCVQSVLEIRAFLTDQLVAGDIGDDLTGVLRGMRAACRKFVGDASAVQAEREILRFADLMGAGGWVFNQSLGELRGVIGVQIAHLSVRYGLDVPEPLVATLPLLDDT